MLNLNVHAVDRDTYRTNYRQACRLIDAAADAIAARRFDGTPADSVADLIQAVGYADAVEAVALLVNSVGDWDERISPEVRTWAADHAADRATLDRCGVYQPGRVHSTHIDQLAEEMMRTPEPVEPEPEPAAADPAGDVVLIDHVQEWTGTPAEADAVQEALQEAVCTDHGGKMAGIPSISTSPSENPYCAARAKNPDLICHECYAAALEAMRKGLAEKLRRSTALLTAAAYPVDLLPVFPAGPARIESFGDVSRVNQAVNYVRIARRNPWATFAAWTKNPWIWDRAFTYDGGKPGNLIMKHIYNTDVITTNAGNMIQTLFCVKTVFPGASGPSAFYFTKYGPAASFCDNYNGELSAVIVETTRPITAGCSCWSWCELEYNGVVRVLYECETAVRSFRIWGTDGHRQRESFCESFTQDMSAWTIGRPGVRWMEVCNADLTGTNDYTIVTLVRPSAAEIDQKMRGQLSDGLFENSRYGLVEEIDPQTWEVIRPLPW